jgi:hypothetical protein
MELNYKYNIRINNHVELRITSRWLWLGTLCQRIVIRLEKNIYHEMTENKVVSTWVSQVNWVSGDGVSPIFNPVWMGHRPHSFHDEVSRVVNKNELKFWVLPTSNFQPSSTTWWLIHYVFFPQIVISSAAKLVLYSAKDQQPRGYSSRIDITRWCPPSYKLVYNPINYRYITYKP